MTSHLEDGLGLAVGSPCGHQTDPSDFPFTLVALE